MENLGLIVVYNFVIAVSNNLAYFKRFL